MQCQEPLCVPSRCRNSPCIPKLPSLQHKNDMMGRQLKEELGANYMAKMDLPSGRAFLGINKWPECFSGNLRSICSALNSTS